MDPAHQSASGATEARDMIDQRQEDAAWGGSPTRVPTPVAPVTDNRGPGAFETGNVVRIHRLKKAVSLSGLLGELVEDVRGSGPYPVMVYDLCAARQIMPASLELVSEYW